MKSEFSIRKALIHNYCDCIEELVNSTDMDIPNLCFKTSTKESTYTSIGHHNIIQMFIFYFHYQLDGTETINDDWVKITNKNLNEFRITGYDVLERLCMNGLINPRSESTLVNYKPYFPVDNLKKYIKH